MMDICGYEYHPDGVCAYQIRFDLIDGVVRNAEIRGGCDGGHQGLSHMVEGRTPEEIIGICKKVGCHDGNSCPKQLALALDELHWNEIVGCVAGDDTVMCAIRTVDDTLITMDKINKVLQ